jgi:membrane-bound lytic murein transglycosylase D
LKDLPNLPQYKPVKVSNQLDLALAADAAGISLDKLYELNPGFRGQYADIDGSYHLYIPAEKKAAEFRQEVERLSLNRRTFAPQVLEPEPVPVEPGAFQSFRREFARRPPYTNGKPVGGRFIPMSMTSDTERESMADSPAAESPSPRLNRLRAAPISSMASREITPARETETRRIAAASPSVAPPSPRPAVQAPISTPKIYNPPAEVESLMADADSVESPPPRPAKRRAEPRDVAPRPEPGPRRVVATAPAVESSKPQTAKTVAVAAKPAPSALKKTSYSVQRGETLYGVARKHSVNVAELAKWNNIPITTEVQAGQKLVVAAREPDSLPVARSTVQKSAAKEPKPTAKAGNSKTEMEKPLPRQANESRNKTVAASGKPKPAAMAESAKKPEKPKRGH